VTEDAAKRLREWRAHRAIILGSGLNSLLGNIADDHVVPYANFKEIPQPSVPGHPGRFVLGEVNKSRVIFAQGRLHLYEGRSAREVTAVTRVLADSGIKELIVTNAAGTMNKDFVPGSWMMITDHLNLTGTTPFLGNANFIDMSECYSPNLRKRFQAAAKNLGLTLYEGVYAGLLGPQYETPAEVRMLRSLGADAVGMSTVLEVIQARALELEVAGFSCLTNWAAGLGTERLSHGEVLETGKTAAKSFAQLLQATF
jgi:purine-nucleoside phosphorylase